MEFAVGSVSPCGLRPGGESLEALADLELPRGVQFVYVHILELQHEPQPVVRVPAERETGGLLLAAKNATRDRLGHASNDIAVEVDRAVASCDFPGTHAAVPDTERMINLGPGPDGPRDIVGDRLSGNNPAALDIAPVEAEPGCRHAR